MSVQNSRYEHQHFPDKPLITILDLLLRKTRFAAHLAYELDGKSSVPIRDRFTRIWISVRGKICRII